jgi:hypothetical protein
MVLTTTDERTSIMATNETSTSTRRAILAGAAAIPALSLPGLATERDPIFAAIECHRQAEAAIGGVSDDDDELDACCDRAWAALMTLVSMTPTTAAGCAAMLRYIEAHEAENGRGLIEDATDGVLRNPAASLLSRIATTLETA